MTKGANRKPAPHLAPPGHKKLDAAVFAACGWPADLSDEEILERLLTLNLQRAGSHSTV
jgi:hypothetical protein